jgi:small subunit ribosomal protein S12
MGTINQLTHTIKLQKKKWTPSKKLKKCPLKRGIVYVVYTGSPKKPNSGKRKLAKVVLTTGKRAIVAIPDGMQHGGATLQKFSRVLIRGGRCQDMPGCHYKILRTSMGRISDTMCGSVLRRQRRSKFGVPRG